MASACRQPFTQLKVQMDGKVYACSQGQFVGNINSEEIEEIWNGTLIIELRERLTEERYDEMCSTCPLFKNIINNVEQNLFDEILKFKKLDSNFIINDKKYNNKNKALYHIDNNISNRNNTIINGWVIDSEKNKCVDKILIIINGRMNGFAKLSIKRNDVAIALKNEAFQNSGFNIETNFISIEKKVELIIISNNEIIGLINVR